MKHILVISPHPDDEAIGCGGTLRKHVLGGDEVQVIFLTSGEQGGHGWPLEETARVREVEARTAAAILGIEILAFFREPDGRLRATQVLVEKLIRIVRQVKPDVIYVPHRAEQHPDHRSSFRLVKAVQKAVRKRALRPEILAYEIWTPIQRISYVEDISEVMETKLRAIRAYESQCRIMDFEGAIEGLNRYRGEMHSWPGGRFAEVFESLDH